MKIEGYDGFIKIAEGGMATVYKAEQSSLHRTVAIKVLDEKLADNPQVLRNFKQESTIIANLLHPNIIHIIDRGITADNRPYFAMEYVRGVNLAQAIEEGNLDFSRKLDLVIQICKALSYAHKNGVIHRDIKPSNVLIDTEGHAKVFDFGIAQLLEYRKTGDARAETSMGSLSYMAPEQIASPEEVTVLSDLYSLGVLMYELFTGERPQKEMKLPSDIEPTLPSPLERLILRCLEPDPLKRNVTVEGIKQTLLKISQGDHLEKAQKERAVFKEGKGENKFSLLDVIKEDAYSAVYLYENRPSNNLLVIKKQPARNPGYTEAKLLTSIKHDHIVDVLGTSKNKQVFIVVMEYISGGSLKDRLIRPMQWGEALKIARQICRGLSFAHKNRIVHGNLRPSNILFTEQGQVKLTDFGLQEHYLERKNAENWYSPGEETKSAALDIFGAGVIFYQMLTNELPEWKGVRLAPNRQFKLLPERLRGLISAMLARQRSQRIKSFDHVLSEIDDLLDAFSSWKESAPTAEVHPAAAKGLWKRMRLRTRVLVSLLFLSAAVLIILLLAGHIPFITQVLDRLFPAS